MRERTGRKTGLSGDSQRGRFEAPGTKPAEAGGGMAGGGMGDLGAGGGSAASGRALLMFGARGTRVSTPALFSFPIPCSSAAMPLYRGRRKLTGIPLFCNGGVLVSVPPRRERRGDPPPASTWYEPD